MNDLYDRARERDIMNFVPDNLRKKGRDEMTGPCPLCGGDDRFNVQPARGTFLCRKCHPKYGDVIEYVRWWMFGNLLPAEGRRRAAEFLSDGEVARAKARPREEKLVEGWQPPYWSRQAVSIVSGFIQDDARRIQMWQAYRPLTEEVIRAKKLGVGVLPVSQCKHERLIVPVYENGILVALRGRQIDCDCAIVKPSGETIPHRWLNSGGIKKSLYGIDEIPEGSVVVAVENNADALLVDITYPGWHGIAPTTGAGTWWTQDWLHKIRLAKPKIVIVAFDNDEAGQKSGEARVKQLRDANIPARQWTWTPDAPPKADMGWYIMEYLKRKVAA